ncbi:hypothetical protein B0O99DRAFT_646015 [Bisporella sp. PMI_857]|nr:hypothetical protein B0O99DRAFT_646015 [Bisporella sp. PMI_857]
MPPFKTALRLQPPGSEYKACGRMPFVLYSALHPWRHSLCHFASRSRYINEEGRSCITRLKITSRRNANALILLVFASKVNVNNMQLILLHFMLLFSINNGLNSLWLVRIILESRGFNAFFFAYR